MGKLPECVNSAVKFGISQRRIADFLRCGDVEQYVEGLDDGAAAGVVDISQASFDAGAAAAAEQDRKPAAASARHSHSDGRWWRKQRQPPPAGRAQLEICSPSRDAAVSGSLRQPTRLSAADVADDAYRLDVRTGDEAEEASAAVRASPPILVDLTCCLQSGVTMICGSVGSGQHADADRGGCCPGCCGVAVR